MSSLSTQPILPLRRIVSVRELSLPLSVGDCRFGLIQRPLQCFLRQEPASDYSRGDPPGVFDVFRRIGFEQDQINNLSLSDGAELVKHAYRLGGVARCVYQL